MRNKINCKKGFIATINEPLLETIYYTTKNLKNIYTD